MQPLNFFKCLADDTRLNMVILLIQYQELCVCEFTARLQLSQPKISRHLALLRAAGVLADRRQGQWVYYRISSNLPAWAKEILASLQQADTVPHVAALTHAKADSDASSTSWIRCD